MTIFRSREYITRISARSLSVITEWGRRIVRKASSISWISKIGPCLLVVYLLCYVAAGYDTHSRFGAALMQDFTHYQNALLRFYAGESPYAVHRIGPGFLYPLAALFIIEIFSLIKPFSLMAWTYISVNIGLMAFMVYGLAKHYNFKFSQIWYWYVLCLAFAPFFELLHIGQINVITMFGVFLCFIHAQKSYVIGGMGLCLAVLTKLSPSLFFAWLAFQRMFKPAVVAAIAIFGISALAAVRYGFQYTLEYADLLAWLGNTFPVGGIHPHSLVAKLVWLNDKLPDIAMLEFAAREHAVVQRLLMFYVLMLILISGVLAWVGRQAREPLFIIVALGMTISPNIMWYHHWVFTLLPLMVWMAWARLNPLTVSWCLFGLLTMQLDRWFLTHGLMIQIYFHICLLMILTWQIRQILSRVRDA